MATQQELDQYKKYYESIGRPDLISSLSSMAVTPSAPSTSSAAPNYGYTPTYETSPTVTGPGGYSQPQTQTQFATEKTARDLAARTGAQGIVSGEWAPGGAFQQSVNPLHLDYGGQDTANAGLVADLYNKYPSHVADAILRANMAPGGGSMGAQSAGGPSKSGKSDWTQNIVPYAGAIQTMSQVNPYARNPVAAAPPRPNQPPPGSPQQGVSPIRPQAPPTPVAQRPPVRFPTAPWPYNLLQQQQWPWGGQQGGPPRQQPQQQTNIQGSSPEQVQRQQPSNQGGATTDDRFGRFSSRFARPNFSQYGRGREIYSSPQFDMNPYRRYGQQQQQLFGGGGGMFLGG